MVKTLEIKECDLKAMLTETAREGSRQALAEVGLDDEFAGKDISNLRELLSSWRLVKKTALQAFVRAVTMFILGAIVYAVTFGK